MARHGVYEKIVNLQAKLIKLLLTCIDNLAKKCFIVKVSQIHLPFHKLIFYSFRGSLNVNPNSPH